MAITRGGTEASGFADFGDSSHALTYSGSAGRLQIAAVIMLDTGGVSFTTPTAANVTFSPVVDTFANGIRVALFAGVSTGAVGNVTFGTGANTADASRVWAREFLSSVGWTSPTDQSDSDTEGSAVTTHPSVSSQLQITTTGSGEILTVGLLGLASSGTSLSTPTGYTPWANIDTGIDLLADRIDASAGTRNFDSVSGAAAVSAMVLASFKEDGAGGSPRFILVRPA
jgi:hypothetical protein